MTIGQMLSQIREKKKLTKDRIVVGSLDDAVVAFFGKKRYTSIYASDIPQS